MSNLEKTERFVEPVAVEVTDDALHVELSDGRTISAPLTWFPRLLHGTPKERARCELGSFGVHWPDLDEDIAVDGLLRGEKSGESSRSLQRWLKHRSMGKKVPVPTFPLPPDMAKLIRGGKSSASSRRRASK